jgi:hypothetical protein
MLDSAILEVIVGLIFIYSLLSIMVTQINTVITNVLNTRAKHLKAGIEALILDPVVRAKFMAHPLIRMIEPEIRPDDVLSAQAADAAAATPPNRITYIPDTLFSQALLDIVATGTPSDLYAPIAIAIETHLNGAEKAKMRELLRRLQATGIGLGDFRAAANTLADPADRAALLDAMRGLEAVRAELNTTDAGSRLIPVLDGVGRIGHPMFQKAMQTLLASARTVEEAAARVEFWFNARMEQLSERYRRHIQALSLLVGLLIALLLNVDTLYLARTLWDDPALRQTISLTAAQQVRTGQLQEQIQESRAALDAAQAEPTPAPPPAEGTAPAPDTFTAQAAQPENAASVEDTLFTLLDLRLPIGWTFAPIAAGCPSQILPDPCADTRNLWTLLPGNTPGWAGALVLKLIGLLMTMIAVAQGAPFWFDLLNRLARGRTGPSAGG